MHCVKCGVEMGDGQFCPACGASRDGVVAAPAAAQPSALNKGTKAFFEALKFRDTDAPEEIAGSITWINWIRSFATILFWVGIIGVILSCLGALISGINSAIVMMNLDALSGVGMIFGSLIGAIVSLALGIVGVFAGIAVLLLVLNWARDTAYIRAKRK
ncbi:MAG: zinc ribbon domain-containing protein [Coriobacteriales bacterium]|jgi:hypothetical protein|nr:zinc ribbon domain-containing protein [Coriobacteriales bacterium]